MRQEGKSSGIKRGRQIDRYGRNEGEDERTDMYKREQNTNLIRTFFFHKFRRQLNVNMVNTVQTLELLFFFLDLPIETNQINRTEIRSPKKMPLT